MGETNSLMYVVAGSVSNLASKAGSVDVLVSAELNAWDSEAFSAPRCSAARAPPAGAGAAIAALARPPSPVEVRPAQRAMTRHRSPGGAPPGGASAASGSRHSSRCGAASDETECPVARCSPAARAER